MTVTDATHLTATVTIAVGATTGASSVTVTTGSEVATGSSLFTVSSGTASVSTISSTTGQQGQVLTGVQITGQFTHFAAGSAVSFSNTGVTASSMTVTDATHLTATVTIAAGATTGVSSVTVTTGSEVATGSNLFTVSSGTAIVSAISPTAGQQGQVLAGVQITGQFTHFAAGSAVSFGNTGVTASSITVTDATHLTATVTIAAGTTTGVSSVTVTTGSEVAAGSNLFTVSLATVVTVAPATATVYGGGTQLFTATVTNTSNIAVTWTVNPTTGAGAIDATGLYTAPTTVATQQTVFITATSQADGAASGTANLTLSPATQSPYLHQRAIVIDHTKVPNTDQTSFPVLISGTYSYLATTANGGQVQNANGYDIIFTSDCAGAVKLDHEIESYNPATGAISMWVRIPTISHTADTIIYMYYGNSAIGSSQENRNGVWDANFQMVLHLGEPAPPYQDSTANGYASTGGVTPTPTAGKIGTGQAFDGVSQYISYSQAQSPNPTGPISMEGWIKTTDTAVKGIFGKWGSDGNGNADQSYQMFYQASGPGAYLNAIDSSDIEVVGGAAINDGNWHHLVVTALPTGSILFYIDGVQNGSLNNSHALLATTADRLLVGATSLAGGNYYMNGALDEVRISNAIRSADWIATEYANQNSPSTFFTISAENSVMVALTPAGMVLSPGQTLQFAATVTGSCNNAVSWSIVPPVGSITNAGLYTASATVAALQSVTITATSQADPTKAASAMLTLTSETVTVAPATVILYPGQTLQFSAAVTNTTNPAVIWSIPSGAPGAIGASGLFTAPASIATQQTVTVTATSQADNTTTGTSTISLLPHVSVTVSPAVATLVAGQTQQFTAALTNTSNMAVTWLVSPAGAGTISAAGLYAAPGNFPGATTVTITATSAADPTQPGTATVNLMSLPIRINSGGPAYTDPAGRVWAADSNASLGCGWWVTTGFAFPAPAGLDGEYADGLTCGSISYLFPVPNMNYVVTLKFADPTYATAGQRVFGVSVNGVTNSALSNVDVAANAGGQYKAWDASIPVSVSNGQINIVFTGSVGMAIINAIEISAANSVEVLPHTANLAERQSLQFAALIPGTSNPAVTWSIVPANFGTITPTGLYTAPTSTTGSTTVTVIAASVASPGISGSSIVSLLPIDPDSFTPIRLNSGGPAYTDPAGRVWAADGALQPSCSSWFGASAFSFTPPAGLDGEYSDGRACSNLGYQFSVPNMNYVVTLKFADPTYANPGQRVFSASINGVTGSSLTNIDIAAAAGGQYKPWDVSVPVMVSNGQINIAFAANVDSPIVNAIEIAAANSVDVLPQSINLSERQSLQFSALIPGTSNPAVTWSIAPANLGTITTTGLYTAPSSITASTPVTVIAASVASPGTSGASVVNLSPTDPNSFTTIRLNSGGPAYTDPAGRVWAPDSTVAPSCSSWFGASAFSFTPPAGLDGEYSDGRACSNLGYQFSVPNMNYVVTLKFADPTYANAGQRVFDVSLNGVTNNALTNIDIAARAGGQYKPWDLSVPVMVTNGQINIAFTAIVDSPIVNAIEIAPADEVFLSPATAAVWQGQSQQFFAVAADPVNAGVTWQMSPSFGALTQTGLYTAPASISAHQSIIVTATSVANPSMSAAASINLWPPAGVTLSPLTATLSGAQTQQFTATPNNGSPLGVTWTIGPEPLGSISATGLYTAPTVYVPSTLSLVATSAADGSTATAAIHLVPAVTVSVSPSTLTLGPSQMQQFTAAVSGGWNTAVTWTATTGAISSTGLYTAPPTISSTTSVTITAVSVANANITATAALTLTPAAYVTVAPASISLIPGQTQQFTATVAGGASVNWSLSPALGTITAAGLYTAPFGLAASAAVMVQATSAADPTKAASAMVTLTSAASAYSYRRAIVIDHTKVPNTDQANFPVLISGTYSYLATVSNGGHVQSASGYDMVFSSDCAGAQQLSHEISSYNPATGAVSFWVLLSDVSHTADTVFYISYGNSAITTSQENRPAVDAALNATGQSADWIATAAANQISPSTFYTVFPENSNAVSPASASLANSQTQQFTPLFTMSAAANTTNPLVLLGTSATPSPAASVAISGNLAYVCDNNEVSVIDVTNPANPIFLGAALATDMLNDGIAQCTVQNRSTGPVLLAFVDESNTGLGNNPAFLAFSLQNPAAPQLLAETGISRQYFEKPVYSSDGNTAFVPTQWVGTVSNNWSGQGGNVTAVNVADLSAPVVLGDMEPAGANAMFGAALANPTTLLVGGSTSTGPANNGVGELVVTDVTNPAVMSLVTTLPAPNTVQIFAPVLQGNLAVALGSTAGYTASGGIEGTPITVTWLGNLVLTTFNIASPRSPSIVASIVLPYTNYSAGPAIQIGVNLSLFAGAVDSSGNNLLLLVDTTNPLIPVVTPYTVPAGITNMTVAGNLLHVTAGAAGYAVYRIPGVTATQYSLSGNCGGPVNFSISPLTQGTISASGLYTAPASVTAGQTVVVTATGQSDPTQTASATVSLSASIPILSLNASTPSPYIVGGSATFAATLTSGGAPVPGVTVTLAVTGANARTITAVTAANGVASLSYTGATRGADAIQASANSFTSSLLSALWVSPSTSFTTTPVTGEFFTAASCPSGCEAFSTPNTQVPAFLQTFPDLMFNPAGTTSTPRSFADLILGPTGVSTGSILAQGNGHVAGAGDMLGFSAVFTGSFVVAQAGSFTINVTSQDGFIFGVSNSASRVSGVDVNPPAAGTTVFSQYPVMAANNGPSTGVATPIVVSFPAAGSYPYEFDYKSGTGGPLSFTVTTTQGSSSVGVPPLESLVLTSNTASPIAGQPASLTLQATDETGAPIPSLPVTVNVAGLAQHTLQATTNSAGLATVSYTETTSMTDVLQAVATLNGLPIVSNQSTLTWTTNNPPSITVAGNSLVTLPGTATYTATVTDPVAPAGGTITVNWTEVSGPGAVSFDAQTLPVTDALFPAPGSYVLQITATDSLGSTSLQIPVTVNPPVTTDQGWILSPIEATQVTGLVPITLIASETLASGTLTYYPLSNPNAVVTLNANTTTAGGGALASLDTTLLPNGSYYIVLDATDTTGKTMGSGVDIVIGGNYKPGRVTTTVTDLVVPAPGLPIQISRTYDSLISGTSSDFGFGWSLSINLQMQIASTNDVTFTINGQQKTFYFTPPSQGLLSFLYLPQYTAEPGFFGTLQATATNCSGNLLVMTGSVYICAIGYAPYQPTTLVYTDPYGRTYTVGATGALQSVQDLAHNTLAVTPTGITSSNGLSVPFVRDAQGRITQITDPLGNIYAYAYDSFGNLASVTYPGITTPAQYTYNTTHLYTGGTDPRGNALPSTTYDSSGRLQTATNALAQTTSYAYNVAGNTTTTTYPPDANGNTGTATMVYDSYGMLLSSTDPLGNTTTNTYDANHNLLSVTDPLAHTTSYTYNSNGNQTSRAYPNTPTSLNTTSTTVYNASSQLTQTTDELGNSRSFTYDANFWPKTASDSIGPVVSFTFNANGTTMAKAMGRDLTATSGVSTTYTYDTYGNMTGQTDALGRQTQYRYDTLGRLSSTTAPAGGVTTDTYDALGHLKTSAQPLGRNSSYTYDVNGNKLSETDANGNATTYQYDALNRAILVTYPTSPATTMAYTYDFRNNAIKTTDQAGHVTNNVYDLAGRLTSMTAAFGTAQAATTSYTYYNDGRKATATDPLGHNTTYDYDAAGRLISTVDAQSNTMQYAYDDAGNQISILDPNNHKTQSQYDARRRLSKTIYDDSTTKQYSYDGPGNLASTTDQAGNAVQYTYDAANQLQSVIQTASPNPQNTTAYIYDQNGNLSNLTDANSHTTQNAFDLLNQLKQKTMPVGQTQMRTYDAAGNLISLTDYTGKTTTYAYDALNRLISRTPDPSLTDTPESFAYTPTSKRASMIDASGTTTYTYDNLDRLITKTTPQGTLNYTYDTAGNVASMSSSNANGASVAYTYDNLDRLSSVIDNRLPVGQNATTYSYDPVSNLATVTYPNGLSSAFAYDDLNRAIALNASTASYNYTLGPAGNRLSAAESTGRVLSWTYDGIYRLTNETVGLDPHSKNGSVGYGLDPVGNRLSQTSTLPGISMGSFTYSANDLLSTETYDNNGNTTVSGARTFWYDFENRLKGMNAGTVTLQYDGDGNRVAKTVGGVTTRYLVDNLNPTGYAQVVEELAGGAVQRTYTYGTQRIGQSQLINSAWTPSFYGYDGSATVRLLANSSGTVTDTYDYDAWGNAVNVIGSTSNLYLYRGEQYDPDLGLYFLRARYYNPMTGRLLSRDPASGRVVTPVTLHKYLYANGNPVDYSDPSGRGCPEFPPCYNPDPVPEPAPDSEAQGGGRSALEYATLVASISLVAVSSVVQVGDRDECVWYNALDTISVAALKVALDNNNDFSPDTSEGTKQAGKRDCPQPWKCLIRCDLSVDGATISKKFNFLAEGKDANEDVESVCLKAANQAKALVVDIPGVAIRHCYNTLSPEGKGTRITWRRPEDAPIIKNGMPFDPSKAKK